jgi:hypothetical protein
VSGKVDSVRYDNECRGDNSEMSKCLRVLRDVAVDLEGQVLVMGDLFVTEDSLNFIPYTPFTPSSVGIATITGAILYGPAGILAGQIVDGLNRAFQSGKAKSISSVEQAKQNAAEERRRDFGMSVQTRLSLRHGVSIPRSEISKLEIEEEQLLVSTKAAEKLRFQGGSSHADSKIAQATLGWHRGQLSSPEGNMEGVNVGVGITDLLDRMVKTPVPQLDEFQLDKIRSDEEWIDQIIDRINKLPRAHRELVTEWFSKEGADLSTLIKAKIVPSLLKTRDRLTFYIALLIMGLVTLILSLIGIIPAQDVPLLGFLGLIAASVGVGVTLSLGWTLIEKKSILGRLG